MHPNAAPSDDEICVSGAASGLPSVSFCDPGVNPHEPAPGGQQRHATQPGAEQHPPQDVPPFGLASVARERYCRAGYR